MDSLDNKIDKQCCSKFILDPAFMYEMISQTDYKIKNAYALEVDPNEIECDTNVIKEFTKCFYDLGIT